MATTDLNPTLADRIVSRAEQRRRRIRSKQDPMAAPAQMHSPTSVEAGETIKKCGPVLRLRVLDFLRDRGQRGATDEEMQLGLGMPASTQRPRRIELVELHLVHDSGATRPTLSKRQAVVWMVA